MRQLTLADIGAMRVELFKRGLCPLGPNDIPPKLIPLFEGPADVRFSFGGRGGAKSWSFAKMAATRIACLDFMGQTGVALFIREFMNSLDDSSLQDLKNAIQSDAWLTSVFDVGEKYIRTKSGRIKCIFAGTSVNLSSIKSKSKILLCLAEEAEYIQSEAWEKLIPTIREEGSELWAIYNPETDRSYVHKNFRLANDPLIRGVEINWHENPWFTAKMDRDRLRSKENDPDNYDHIWEGGMKTVTKGAYIARDMTKARVDGRITTVPHDPLLIYRLFVDIGGTGARADNFVIWVKQFVGKTINVLDHYEVQGQPIAAHLKWMREKGYDTGNTKIWLPHDGDQNDRVFDVNYRSALEDAGYDVEVVPNQGKGAAMFRVEAARRMMPAVWFNENTTEAGRKALAHYHAKIDEARGIDLGPEHDWSSHSFDAFGMGCLVYEEPAIAKKAKSSGRQRHWMG